MAKTKAKWISSEAAANGYALTADGSGGASWQAAGAVTFPYTLIKTTDDLAAVINAASNGEVFLIEPGTHTVTDPVTISGKSDISVYGFRSSIIDLDLSAGASDFITITDSDDIRLSGFTVDAVLQAGRAVVRFVSSASAMVRNIVSGIVCNIQTNNARFIYQDTGNTRDLSDFVIEDNRVTGLILDGIYMDSGADTSEYYRWRIQNNKFFSSYASAANGIFMDCGNPDKAALSVSQNHIDSFTTGIYVRRGKSSSIDANAVFNTLAGSGYDIQAVDCREALITGNVCKNGGGAGSIIADSGWSLGVIDNVIRDPAGYGITSGAVRGTVSGNNIYSPGLHGLRLTGSDMVAANNQISGVPKTAAIYALEITADRCAVTGTYVEGGQYGFRINGSADSVFSGCYALDSLVYGFVVTGNAVTLDGCASYGSDSIGFYVDVTQTQLVGCRAEDSTSDGFRINKNRCLLSGCYSKTNGGKGYQINERYTEVVGCYAVDNTGDGFAGGTNAQSSQFGQCHSYSNGGKGFAASFDNAFFAGCYSRDNGESGYSGGNNASYTGCHSVNDGSASGDYGFNVSGADVSVAACYARGSWDHGFYVPGDQCHISGCYAQESGDAAGIIGETDANGFYLSSSNNTMVDGCYSQGNAENGIRLNNSDGCLVNGCRCYNNAGDGIVEESNCDGNMYSSNHLVGNTGDAFDQNGTNTTIGTQKGV